MIELSQFCDALGTFRPRPDRAQRRAVEASPERPLYIVAGPGSGKTTALTLRILKLILVDGVAPSAIVATTFTRKAAAELRSRVLGWGFRLVEALDVSGLLSKEQQAWLAAVDVNQVVTGTLDSLCEQLLRDHREAGAAPPVVTDETVSRTLLLRDGLVATGLYRDEDLDEILLELAGGSRWGWTLARKNERLHALWSRRFHDQVEWHRFVSGGPAKSRAGRQALDDAFEAYSASLEERGMVDFTLLEQTVLDRLNAGELERFTSKLEVVLVDEYQDTNLLQEKIYLRLAEACGGALTVVGDDDQSLYRFRGATVELFSGFPERYKERFGRRPRAVFLGTNYRSTRRIVDPVNDFAGLDDDYQAERAEAKPALRPGPTAPEGVPVLGMFRDDIETLSFDLARFVKDVFRGDGFVLPDGSRLQRAVEGGDVGDCALLCSSPRERSGARPRLPALLREALAMGRRPVEVFNPRGQALAEVDVVVRLGGMLLECLDPGGAVEAITAGLTGETRDVLKDWRARAEAFVASKDAPWGLRHFVTAWSKRDPKKKGLVWPAEVAVLELIWGLVHFLPELHDDPEGQVYLEVFTRQASACEQVGRYPGQLLYAPNPKGRVRASIQELLRNLLAPIATGAASVDESLLEAFPRDRLSVLSIHQAKGLEFPMVIVDTGSDFRTRHRTQEFKRFPVRGGTPHLEEDLLRPFTELGGPARSGRDRAFDDLSRQLFVAFSRPRQVLLLTGLRSASAAGWVQNVAAGYDRRGQCHWADRMPYLEI